MPIAIFCLTAFAGLCVLGLIVVAVVWGQHARARSLEQFAEMARRMGLALEGPQQMSGAFGRGWLTVTLTTERRGSGKRRRSVSVTRYWVRPPVPLRMALNVQTKAAFFGDIADALGLASDIQVGRADLDEPMRIGAIEPEHAARVLTEEPVTQAILGARHLNRFRVTDHEAFAQHDGWATDQAALEAYARPLGRVVDALAEARARHRASWERQVDATFSNVASYEGLTYAPEATAIMGTLPTGTLRIGVVVGGSGPLTQVEVTVAQPLGHGIEMYRAGLTDDLGKMFGGQDITLGVPAIDEPYVVKARNDVAARALLSGIAPDLAKLHEALAALQVSDTGLRATALRLIVDPTELTAVVRALVRVCHALSGSNADPSSAFR